MIMVVDDEPDILSLACFRLKANGYEIITATGGHEALELLKTVLPDLILLDFFMPKVGGDQVCKYLKSDDRLKKIPVILFTASTTETDKKAKEICADDYLIKPFDPQALLDKVKKMIG